MSDPFHRLSDGRKNPGTPRRRPQNHSRVPWGAWAFFLLGAFSFLLCPQALRAERIKVGLLIPLQGSATEADSPYLRGAELAVAEVNANEGKQGAQFLLFVHRGSFLHPRDLNGLRDLFFEQRLHFLIGALPRESILPVSRLAQEHGIPFLAFPIDFLEAASSGDEPPNLFWISPTPEAFQRAAVRTAAQFNKKRIYLLARNTAPGRNWVKYFWEEMGRLRPDAQRVGETYLPARTDDFTPYLQSVLAADAEVCLSHLGVKDWLGFYRAGDKQDYFKKLIHLDLEAGRLESLTAMRKKSSEGIWGISGFPFWALGWKETKEFVSKYRKNTQSFPPLAAVSGYISIYALFEAAKKAGSLDSEKAAKALEDLNFPSLVGQMKIRKTDRRTMWPIWTGSLQSSSDYPFPILGDLKTMGPDSFSP